MNRIKIFGIPYLEKGSGIHIKKKNRGSFTKYCKDKVTQECIDKAKRSGNPKLVKKAVFAENSRKWSKKHQQGGTATWNRVNFEQYAKDPLVTRKLIPQNMRQIEDSLIARQMPYAQRLALLASVAEETGGDPTAIDETGKFKGIIQWEDSRYPNTEDLGEQIHWMLTEIYNPKMWTHGGGGLPVIKTAREGFDKFWNNKNVYDATLYLNKGYIRPKEEGARVNRANKAKIMQKYD